MQTMRNLRGDLEKTGSSSMRLIAGAPQDALLDIFSGKNPIPGIMGDTRNAVADIMTLPLRMSSSLLGGMARGVGRSVLGILKNIPLPTVRLK